MCECACVCVRRGGVGVGWNERIVGSNSRKSQNNDRYPFDNYSEPYTFASAISVRTRRALPVRRLCVVCVCVCVCVCVRERERERECVCVCV